MLLEGFGPGRACALGSISPQMVALSEHLSSPTGRPNAQLAQDALYSGAERGHNVTASHSARTSNGTSVDERMLIGEYLEGATALSLANRCGISVRTVKRILNRNSVRRPR